MGLFKINLEHIWNKSFKDTVHNAAIGNLVGDINPEILGSSFDHTLKAFDLSGTLKFETEFPPEITQFMCESITTVNAIELISGDINGNIRLMSKKGRFIWSTNVKSAVVSIDIGDVTGDAKLEIIVITQNQRICLINHRGELLFEGDAPTPIIDVSLGPITSNNKQNMIALSRNGDIFTVNFANQWQKLLHLDGLPTCFTHFIFEGMKGFLIGYENGAVKVINTNGLVLAEYACGSRINDIDKRIIKVDNDLLLYMVLASGNDVHLFQLHKGEALTEPTNDFNANSLSLSEFDKPFPVIMKNDDLKTAPNPVSTRKNPKKDDVSDPKKTIKSIPENPKISVDQLVDKDKKRLKCPECKNYLPSDFEVKILKGLDVFCESCGALLRKDMLPIMKK